MPAYTWKKPGVEYAKILNVSDVVHSIRSALYKLLGSCQTKTYSQHCQTFKMERFCKKSNVWGQMHNQKCFRAKDWRRWFVELEHFDKHSSKTQEKETPQGNILEIFFLDTLKTTLWMENLTQRWAQSGPFFLKPGHFFQFSETAVEASPLPPCCASVNVDEYASISLNMPKYPWKYFMKLFWLC